MSALLEDNTGIVELSGLLRTFFSTELESSKLRCSITQEKGKQHKLLWTRLAELDLHSAFFKNDGPESSLPGLAQLAFECGRALVPVPLWETVMAGPYLFGQLGAIQEEFSQSELTSAIKKISAVMSRDLVKPIRGLHDLAAIVVIDGSSVSVLKIGPQQIESTTNELDILGHYGKLSAKPATKAQEIAELNDTFKLLLAAELAGIAERSVEMTVEYLKVRKQFEVPIGGFQAVQHKAADMHLHSEAMRALIAFALRSYGKDAQEFSIASRSALSYATDHTALIIENAIQLHGGIGFTWEHDLHLYLRRAKQIELNHSLTTEEANEVVDQVR